jgi:hypothetical protein
VKDKFLTASGFLTAILLVWATLWVASAQMYPSKPMSTIGTGLVYVYWGILASMLVFVLTVFTRGASRPAVVAMSIALTMTALEVVGSLVSVVWKMVGNLPLWQPLPIASRIIPSQLPWSLIPYLIILLGISAIWMALVYWLPSKKFFNSESLFQEQSK